MKRLVVLVAVLALALYGADVIQRRLLMGGGGSFTVPAPPVPFTVSTITSPGEGGGVWFGGPRAITNGTETILGYQTGDSGFGVVPFRQLSNMVR